MNPELIESVGVVVSLLMVIAVFLGPFGGE